MRISRPQGCRRGASGRPKPGEGFTLARPQRYIEIRARHSSTSTAYLYVMGGGDCEEHQSPAVRACDVTKPVDGGSCGFHLTRTKWDPYPWVCGVDGGSPAGVAGLRVGDCVLEVNGEDVLGLRVSDIAARVRARDQTVTMLLWNSGVDPHCDPESLCCGPMPTSLQRLSSCMNSILAILECPVCLDTIPPPAHQCCNGHLICVRCRLQSERCPVCRARLGRGRSLLADKVYNSLTEAFLLRDEPPETRSVKMRQRLIGKKMIPEKGRPVAEVKPTVNSPKNKFLSRIMGKSSSVENLSSNTKSSNLLSVDSCFNSNMKSKSLSSNEIFNQISPAVSQLSIPTTNTADIGLSSSRSYQGSFESLTQRMMTDFGEMEVADDGATYACPASPECTAQLGRTSVFRHLQNEHRGPLVQYFTSQITLDFPHCLPEDALITISGEGNVYFLKIMPKNEIDFLVWMWVLGGKFNSEALKLVLTLRSEDTDSPELIFKSAVHSLVNTTWAEIVSGNKGVLLKKDMMDATFKNQSIKLQVNVSSKATQATAV